MYTLFAIFGILYFYGLYNFFYYKPKYDLSDKDLLLFVSGRLSLILTVFIVLFLIIELMP